MGLGILHLPTFCWTALIFSPLCPLIFFFTASRQPSSRSFSTLLSTSGFPVGFASPTEGDCSFSLSSFRSRRVEVFNPDLHSLFPNRLSMNWAGKSSHPTETRIFSGGGHISLVPHGGKTVGGGESQLRVSYTGLMIADASSSFLLLLSESNRKYWEAGHLDLQEA